MLSIPNQFIDNFRRVELRDVSRIHFEQLAFHDQRALDDYPITEKMDQTQFRHLLNLRCPDARPLHWVFHIAFGGSTLVAKFLQSLTQTTAFREPYVLTQLSMQRRQWDGCDNDWASESCHAMWLADSLRWFASVNPSSSVTVIKPHDIANYLISIAMNHHSLSKAIVIVSELESFLVSVLKEQGRRKWIRSRLDACGIERLVPIHSIHLDRLTDSEAAACVWLGQLTLIGEISKRYHEKVKMVKSEQLALLTAPTLADIACHFMFDCDVARAESILAAVGQSHSKSNRRYDRQEREALNVGLRERYAVEIESGIKWARRCLEVAGIQPGNHQAMRSLISRFGLLPVSR